MGYRGQAAGVRFTQPTDIPHEIYATGGQRSLFVINMRTGVASATTGASLFRNWGQGAEHMILVNDWWANPHFINPRSATIRVTQFQW